MSKEFQELGRACEQLGRVVMEALQKSRIIKWTIRVLDLMIRTCRREKHG